MKRVILAVAGLFLGAGTAQAATCEDSFTKSGSPVTGLRSVATTTVPNMSMASAVGQINGIVAAKGYAILAAEPASGAMLVEPPAVGKSRPFPIEIAADGGGRCAWRRSCAPEWASPMPPPRPKCAGSWRS